MYNPNMGKISTVIYDLEGVVIDSEPIWTRADLLFLKNHGVSITLDEYEANIKHLLMGLVLYDGVALMKRHYGFKEDPLVLANERRGIVKSLFGEKVSFIPGFTEFHRGVRDAYTTAIATSLERYFLDPVNRRLELAELFNGNLFSVEDIGFISKPNPAIFLHVANTLNVNPQNCLVIEDAPNGVEAAKRAGMRCIALTTSSPRERLTKVDLIVDTYREIDLGKL